MSQVVYAAEDDATVRTLIERVLAKAGFEVKAFEDASVLLEAASKKPPDLFVLDIAMPGQTGLEALACLKQETATQQVPVVMLTAKNSPDSVIKARHLGANDYVIKPFDHSDLVKRALLHTYQFSVDEIRSMLTMCNVADNITMTKPGLRKFRNQGVDCYPIGFAHFPVCMLVRMGVVPAALSRRPEEEIRAAVRAYAKGVMWLPVWPSRSEDYALAGPDKKGPLDQADVDDLLKLMTGGPEAVKS